MINVQHKSWPGTVVVVWPKYLPHLLLLLLLYPPQLHRSLHQKQEELEPEVGYKACRDTDRVGTVVAVHADTNTFDIKWPDTSEIETGLSYTPSESTSDGDEDEGEKETEEGEKETAEEGATEKAEKGETEAAEEVEKEAAEEVEEEMQASPIAHTIQGRGAIEADTGE